jgi:hypothetical protein
MIPVVHIILVLGRPGCNYLFSLKVKATVKHLMHAKSTLNARPAHHHPSKSVVLIYRVLDPTHIHHMCMLIIK